MVNDRGVHILGQQQQPDQTQVLQAMAIALQDLNARVAQQDQQLMMMSDLIGGLVSIQMGSANVLEMHPSPITLSTTETGIAVHKIPKEDLEAMANRSDA